MISSKEVEKNAQSETNDMELGIAQETSLGDVEEIKRDLQSRHINMIAIAGMIVSRRL